MITPEAYGAVGDGTTDDSTALQNCFNAAGGQSVYLNPTKSYRHTVVLTISMNSVTVTGGGTLLATAEQTSALLVSGQWVTLDGIVLRMSSTTQRWNEYEKMKLRITGDNFIARNVLIDGSAAAGVYMMAGYFLLERVYIQNTRADGVFTSEGAHDGVIIGCTANNTGDDGFSVVSYAGTPCHHITNIGSAVLNGQARGLSVIGGNHVSIADFYVDTTQAAGVYVYNESDSYDPITNVSVRNGTIVNANQAFSTIAHGAILLGAAQTRTLQKIEIQSIAVRDTASGAPWIIGVQQFDTATVNGIAIADVAISNGPTTVLDLVSVTPAGNSIYYDGISRNGISYSDQARDDNFQLVSSSDNTKRLQFSLSGVSTATTRILTVPNASDTLAVLAAVQTLSNKRIVPRVTTITSSATPSVNIATTDLVSITALAVAITNMSTNLTGSPNNGDRLTYRIKDNGTARAIVWGASFGPSGSAALLTTTVANKTHHVSFIFDSVVNKWICQTVDTAGY